MIKRRSKDYSLGEEIANSVTHGVGALLGIAALVLLLVEATTGIGAISAIIYSLSIILLFTMSTLYHAFPPSKVKRVFKRFDHLSIYVLIAGTYTPLLLVGISGTKGLILFGIQWLLVIIGVVFKAIWIKKFQAIHLILFLIMGWMGIVLFNDLKAISTLSLNFILIGGICYTLGVLFYVSRLFKYSHMVWHLFVLAGSVFHFFAAYIII